MSHKQDTPLPEDNKGVIRVVEDDVEDEQSRQVKEKIEAIQSVSEQEGENVSEKPKKLNILQKIRFSYPRWRWAAHLFWFSFFTSWWISILAQPKQRHKWLIPTIIYIMIFFRFVTLYVPLVRWLMFGFKFFWGHLLAVRDKCIPEKFRLPAGAALTIAVMLVGSLVPTETKDSKRADRIISFIGIMVALTGLYLTSTNRSKIRWVTVINGMLMQFIIALFVLRTKAGYDIFKFVSSLSEEFLGFAKHGVAFVTDDKVANLGMFFFTVLPAVLFFIAVVYVLLYLGFIQWATTKFSKFFFWSMKVSGGEAVVAAASPFIGIGESAILIKGLMPYLTVAEIHQVMCSGFATISGSVLISYIALGINPQALVSSCVMSIPASLAVSKLRYPEVENSLTAGDCEIPNGDENLSEEEKPRNVIHAFANGAYLGLVVAGTIMTNQICIISIVALFNGVLTWFGKFWNIKALTLEFMGGYILYPVAFLLGAPRDELKPIAELIAIKFIENEFNGYNTLITKAPYNLMSKRGQLLATYSLCGFSNFGSVGTQIGVLGTLAPKKAHVISKTVFSALITGGISTLLSACVAGMVIHDLSNFQVSNKLP